MGAATLSGFLLGIGFPPSPLTFVITVAWIPLLAVENGIYQRQDRIRPGQVFFYFYHAFVLWNIISTFWVTNTAFVAGLIANFVNAALMATVVMIIHVIGRKLHYKLFALIFITCWISFEYLHHFWDVSWPWLTLGNALAEYPWAIQWYEWTGIFGGSLWILGLNFLGYSVIIRWLRAMPLRIVLVITVLILPLVISVWLGSSTHSSNEQPVSVVVVQPNFEPHYEKFEIPQSQQVLRFLEISRQYLDSQTQYLVFPETSFEGIQLNTFRENQTIAIFQNLINQYPGLNLITGVTSYRILPEKDELNESLRIHTNHRGEVSFWDVQNAALQITSGREDFQVYFKSKFVPGPELFPFRKYLSFLRPIVDKLGGSYEGLTRQEERSVFKGPINVAPVICYESVYGDYVGGYVRNGANALFIVTNDGWWDDTPGHIQHLKIGALRAIEHRRPIARSANTGTSCFIDIKGRIHQPTDYGVTGAVRGEIIPESRFTFYTLYGDIIAIVCVIMAIIFLLGGIAIMLKNRFDTRQTSGIK